MTAAGKSVPQPHWLDPAQPDKLTPIDCDVKNFRDPGWSPDMREIVFRCDR